MIEKQPWNWQNFAIFTIESFQKTEIRIENEMNILCSEIALNIFFKS
jgi:hypothetical protein